MRPLSELKQDFEVSRSLGDIIDVLKTASLIQFRSFQLKEEKANEVFLNSIDRCISTLMQKNISNVYLVDRKELPSCIVVITSDAGFTGELTTLLINAGVDQRKSGADQVLVLGERGVKYMEDMNQNFISLPAFSDEIEYTEMEVLRDYLLKVYSKKFGRILIVYPKFISLTVQRINVNQLLPCQVQIQEVGEFLGKTILDELLIEPDAESIAGSLVNLRMRFNLLEIFWSAKQAEYAARIMHLESSTQELNQLKQKLSFEYFRQVHVLRDKVIREISASKIMLKKR